MREKEGERRDCAYAMHYTSGIGEEVIMYYTILGCAAVYLGAYMCIMELLPLFRRL